MSVVDLFSIFIKNLEMSSNSIENIRNRYKQITKRINLDYRNSNSDTNYSLYVGSYGRNTEIWTSDIDIIVILPYEVYARVNKTSGNIQSYLLQEVKNILKKTYPSSFIKADGQVIGINFSDGISFEIVPTFLNCDQISYTYPDTNNGGSWQVTNPKAEINAMNELNKSTKNNLKFLCRIIRAWKQNCNVDISGILIDTLAYNFIKNWKYNDKSFLYYDFMTRDFFEYLKNLNQSQTYWLAPGSNKKVYKNSNFQSKASTAYQNAIGAIDAMNNKYYFTAKSKWRNIYGTKFPQ